MPSVRVSCFGISLDGYGAGSDQSMEHPLGKGGEGLHRWFVVTRTFRRMHGDGGEGGTTGIDDDFAARGVKNVGAWILGRNMFGLQRGPWTDDGWKGWWGEDPPYHSPVFILTHHAHAPIVMEGGTTFYFVTAGAEAAVVQARAAAGEGDVRIGGGVATVREYLQAKLIDEMHVAIAPVFLGAGESLFAGIDLPALGYAVDEHVPTAGATHIVISRAR